MGKRQNEKSGQREGCIEVVELEEELGDGRRWRRRWRWWRREGPEAAAVAARVWRRRGDDGEVSVAGARSGDGHRGGGGGDDDGWTPFPAFLEQPLERERTPFFLQMTARVCGGGGPFPSYRTYNGPRGERAHLRPTTHT